MDTKANKVDLGLGEALGSGPNQNQAEPFPPVEVLAVAAKVLNKMQKDLAVIQILIEGIINDRKNPLK